MYKIKPDIEVEFHFNDIRKGKVKDGYRPSHIVCDNYLTTGLHHYYYLDNLEKIMGTITFLTPDIYPKTMWIGKLIEMYEGTYFVGYAIVTKVFNTKLLGEKPLDYKIDFEKYVNDFNTKRIPRKFKRENK